MLTAATPPMAVPVFGGFDYVTVDAARRRVYAAHTGAKALAIVDADSGAILGQARLGAIHGVAVDPRSGHVFAGDEDGAIVEVDAHDPGRPRVVRTVKVDGSVDAVIFDPVAARIYADEDNGTKLWVLDARTFSLRATVALPGHKPEYLALDRAAHAIYQNISDLGEIAVVDTRSLSVVRTIRTTGITGNHPLQYDPGFKQIVVGGTNGSLAAYAPAGKLLGRIRVPRFDQCDLDPRAHLLACAGGGGITRIRLRRGAAPTVIETTQVDRGVHTAAIDPSTGAVFAVWGRRDGRGDFVQEFLPQDR